MSENRDVVQMPHDTRPICCIIGDPVDGVWEKVGKDGVTAITGYYESGQMAAVPWCAVWVGDDLKARVNAALLSEILYAI